jgi:putative hydroxymethylpyrimidine transport system substrate-binding protein
VTRLPEVGVPNYNELVIATSDSYAQENPDVVRRFVDVLVEGHRYALKNPEAARDAFREANEELDPEVAEEAVALTVSIFEADPIGYQNTEEWQAYVDRAVENDVLPGPVDVDTVMTNKYLPES